MLDFLAFKIDFLLFFPSASDTLVELQKNDNDDDKDELDQPLALAMANSNVLAKAAQKGREKEKVKTKKRARPEDVPEEEEEEEDGHRKVAKKAKPRVPIHPGTNAAERMWWERYAARKAKVYHHDVFMCGQRPGDVL
jgi:hypothetical protein